MQLPREDELEEIEAYHFHTYFFQNVEASKAEAFRLRYVLMLIFF